jgi:hypothetical protein
VAPPVPIPNTEVKRLSADDTERVTFWENMPLPEVILFMRHIFTIINKPTHYPNNTLFFGLNPLT